MCTGLGAPATDTPPGGKRPGWGPSPEEGGPTRVWLHRRRSRAFGEAKVRPGAQSHDFKNHCKTQGKPRVLALGRLQGTPRHTTPNMKSNEKPKENVGVLIYRRYAVASRAARRPKRFARTPPARQVDVQRATSDAPRGSRTPPPTPNR